MKRLFDFIFVLVLAVLGGIPLLVIYLLVKSTSRGPALYWSDRIGRDNRIFKMPKFRTMRLDAPEVASHLLDTPDRWLTPIGNLLRRTSLDELPQLWSILRGDMSLVGPRPALHNQDDLVALRTHCGVHILCPGLTGWAQINGRDETPIPEKVAHDEWYLRNRTLLLDIRILVLTVFQVVSRKNTSVPEELSGIDQSMAIPAEAYLASGASWFHQGEFERAISAYDHVLDVDPNNVLALNNRGAAWMAKGNARKAQEDYQTAVRLSPDFGEKHPDCEFVRSWD